ncbi:hypothetical protein ABEB36_015751 [Hypothenemus hampei]|uniref:Uncharacterized protein n=1 Tax=Hypothenemus hampei TaxID=57062 RepID=A0ABD1DYU8_HYPHA
MTLFTFHPWFNALHAYSTGTQKELESFFNPSEFPKISKRKDINPKLDQKISPNQRRNEHFSNNKTKRSFAQVSQNPDPRKKIILQNKNNQAINECLIYPNGRPSKNSPKSSPNSFVRSSIESDLNEEPFCAESRSRLLMALPTNYLLSYVYY